jgi:hypothetical protein
VVFFGVPLFFVVVPVFLVGFVFGYLVGGAIGESKLNRLKKGQENQKALQEAMKNQIEAQERLIATMRRGTS